LAEHLQDDYCTNELPYIKERLNVSTHQSMWYTLQTQVILLYCRMCSLYSLDRKPKTAHCSAHLIVLLWPQRWIEQ
jgi:hypothetical protein